MSKKAPSTETSNKRKGHPTFTMESADVQTGQAEFGEIELLSEGHMHFFYRPKVQLSAKDVHGFDDVARFYVVLAPTNIHHPGSKTQPSKKKKQKTNDNAPNDCVVLIMTSKMLPNANIPHDTHWAFVDHVSRGGEGKTPEQVFQHYSYDTKTRGKREVAGAVPCGSATYELLLKDTYVVGKTKVRKPRTSAHLVYKLVMPQADHLGPVQRAFNIHEQGDFILQVKNPNAPASRSGFVGLKKKATFPPDVQRLFTGVKVAQRRFIPLTDMRLLLSERAEIQFTPMTPAKELQLGEAAADFERASDADIESLEEEYHHHLEELVYKELQLDQDEHPTKSLVTGKW